MVLQEILQHLLEVLYVLFQVIKKQLIKILTSTKENRRPREKNRM